MKLFLGLLIFSFNAYADTCNYTWDINVNGFNAGKAYDQIVIDKNQYVVRSTFRVNKLLGYFNVKEYIRTYSFNKKTNEILKEDSIIGDKNKDKIWKAINGKISLDDKIFSYEHLIIDSTIFPYLPLLNQNLSNGTYTVLGKSNIYEAEIKYSTNELLFLADDKSGAVKLKDNRPFYFDFKSGLSSLTAKLIDLNCID